MRKFLLLLTIFAFSLSLVLAQTSGKITGHAKDAKTGEPLIGANIIIEGTTMGAATNIDGYYVILNVPPGTYNVKASMISYASQTMTDVRVYIDQTTSLNFELMEDSYQTADVVVIAKNPIVQKDVSSSVANITDNELKTLPTANLTQVIGYEAGIQQSGDGLIIRGGGTDQTAVLLNGISMKNERTNTPYLGGISYTSVKEVQVQTGGFTAEYGDMRSGLVKVVTKEGDKDKYDFTVFSRYRPVGPKHFGDSPNNPNSFWLRPFLDDEVCWTGTQNWDEYTQRQYISFDGWNAVSEALLKDDDPNNDLTPEECQRLYLWQQRKNLDIHLPDYDLDMSFGGPVPGLQSLGNLRFFTSFKKTRSQYLIPLNTDSYQNYSINGKLTADITSTMKLMVEGLYGKEWGTADNNSGLYGIFKTSSEIASALDYGETNYGDARMYTTDYWAPSEVYRFSLGGKFTHAVNERTFYEIVFSRYAEDYSTNPGRLRDTNKVYLFGNNYWVDEAPFGFYEDPSTGIVRLRMGVGMSNSRDSSFIQKYQIKGDITSQLDDINQFKAGIEFIYVKNEMNYATYDKVLPSGNYHNEYTTTPIRGALYLQDKLEFEGMIANIGIRFDYSDPGGEWWVYDNFTKYFNGKYISGLDTLLEKEATEKKLYVSPRIGLAFPITVDSKLFFNYGHQRQMPTPDQMYLFRLESNTGGLLRIADPNIILPRTVQYEIGYEHNLFDQFLIRVSGYYKDVTDQALLVTYIAKGNITNYSTYEPNSYADIRGFEITLKKNRGDWVQGMINYTYDVSTSGRFGFATFNENKADQRRYELEYRAHYQSKPIPRPYARANIYIFSPREFGPKLGPIFPFGDINLSIVGNWRAGYYSTYVGGGSMPGVLYNVQWKDYLNFDLRLSKNFALDLGSFDLSIELFMDVNNVLNQKYMTEYGFTHANDYNDYMKSLRLPKDAFVDFVNGTPTWTNDPDGGPYIYGDDQPGDYRSDEKPYIDMPNQDWLTFLNLRQIYWGLRMSIQ
ncbi:MAG: TonB-dependent receptor, partial [Ignavibacteriales bacterium]|nr:TonB-dependent receptor [Ignavibacteriales bacterium]